MKEKLLLPILVQLKGNTKELNKVMRFVKSCDYFKGKRRKIYKLIIKYKNNKGD